MGRFCIIIVTAVSDEIDAEESCSSLQSEETVEEEEEKERRGGRDGHPSEGGHSRGRTNGFQQVDEQL